MSFAIFSCDRCKHATLEKTLVQDDKLSITTVKQVGCDLNILGKFNYTNQSKDGEDVVDYNYYILDKVCLHKNEGIEDKKVDIRMGYIFILKDINQLDHLENNLKLISNHDPLWIGIAHEFSDYNQKIISIIEETNPNVKHNVVCNFEKVHDFLKLDQFMKDLKNGWTLVNIVGEYFDIQNKYKVKKFTLEDLKSAAVIKDTNDPEDMNVNNVCFFNFIYKFLKGSTPEYLEEEDVFIEKSFFNKVAEKQISMIKTWSELE
jgi:hypothetical protein